MNINHLNLHIKTIKDFNNAYFRLLNFENYFVIHYNYSFIANFIMDKIIMSKHSLVNYIITCNPFNSYLTKETTTS